MAEMIQSILMTCYFTQSTQIKLMSIKTLFVYSCANNYGVDGMLYNDYAHNNVKEDGIFISAFRTCVYKIHIC